MICQQGFLEVEDVNDADREALVEEAKNLEEEVR